MKVKYFKKNFKKLKAERYKNQVQPKASTEQLVVPGTLSYLILDEPSSLLQSYLEKSLPHGRVFWKIKEIDQVGHGDLWGGIVYSLEACIIWPFGLNYKLQLILIIWGFHYLRIGLLTRPCL